MTKVIKFCSVCGSQDVVKDAWAEWDVETQEWVLQNVFDDTFCNSCEKSQSLDEEPVDGPSGDAGDSPDNSETVSRDTDGDEV